MHARGAAAIVLLAAAIVGCGFDNPGPGDTPPAAASPVVPDALPAPLVTSSATASDADMAKWRAFRTRFGLRHDDAWLRELATDPSAQNDSGVPLRPWELDFIGTVNLSLDGALGVLRSYGELHPDSYAGVAIDNQSTRVAVLLVTRDVETHRAAVGELLPAGAAISADVREVQWSLRDLQGFQERVSEDTDWLSTVGARVLDVTLEIEDNAIRLHYEAPSDNVAERIAQHYVSPSWLDVEWQGPLPWTGPRGALIVRAIDSAGKPVSGLLCDARPTDSAVQYSIGVALLTDEQGMCTFTSVPAATFIAIVTDERHEEWRGQAEVPANGTGRVTIVLP